MALSDDRAALLRLLLSGQSYSDVSSLLGTDAAGVRRDAHVALAELAGTTPGPRSCDRLLGQDPDAVPQGSSDAQGTAAAAETLESASKAAAALRRFEPGASIPEPVASGGLDPRDGSGSALAARVRALPGRTVALIGSAFSLIVVAVVLASTGALSSGTPPDAAGAPTEAENVVVIPLRPIGGSTARGEARLIRVGDLPTLTLDLKSLPPSGSDTTYIIWFYNSADEAFPIGFRDVGSDGKLRGLVNIPGAATALLPDFDALDVSIARDDETLAAIRASAKTRSIPRHAGRSVLRGRFPRGA